jgi:hypothetical protein
MPDHHFDCDQDIQDEAPATTGPSPDTDPLTNAILQYLKLNYEPAADQSQGLNLTTAELYDRITAIHPTPPFDQLFLALWLQQNGFRFADMGDLKFVWLIKPV